MAIFASIFAAAGRFLGRFLNTALGWATILLFGQVPESRRLLLSLITLGSLAWVAVLLGVLIPDVGAFLVAAVLAPEGFEEWVRLGMIVAAVLLPLVIGLGGLLVQDTEDRPAGAAMVTQVLRGYLYTPVLAGVLAFLFVEAPLRRLRALIKRWETAHVPLIVKPGGYETVTTALHDALQAAGLDLRKSDAPRALVLPGRRGVGQPGHRLVRVGGAVPGEAPGGARPPSGSRLGAIRCWRRGRGRCTGGGRRFGGPAGRSKRTNGAPGGQAPPSPRQGRSSMMPSSSGQSRKA